MSLPDVDHRSRRRFLKVASLLVLASSSLALAGCQVRPLYGSMGNASAPVHQELAAIQIETIDEDLDDADAARELYNELTFGFERGQSSPEKRYSLKVVMDLGVAEVGVERLADVPAAYTMTMNATFVLTDIASEKTLTTGKSFATASYDFSNQRYANLRARRDAEARAAKAVAQDMQARIAGYFATRS